MMPMDVDTDLESRPRYGCGYDERQRERQGGPCVEGRDGQGDGTGEGWRGELLKETVYGF